SFLRLERPHSDQLDDVAGYPKFKRIAIHVVQPAANERLILPLTLFLPCALAGSLYGVTRPPDHLAQPPLDVVLGAIEAVGNLLFDSGVRHPGCESLCDDAS